MVKPEVGASSDTWGSKLNGDVDDIDALLGAIALAGGTTAYTLTTGLSLAAYVNGQSFLVRVNATNTGASTLNVDGLGAKNLRKNVAGTLTALAANDLYIGDYVRFTYNSASDVIVLMGAASGVWQPLDATLTALAGLSTSASKYVRATGTDTFTMDSYATVLSNIAALSLAGGTLTSDLIIANNTPLFVLSESDQGSDGKRWGFRSTGGTFQLFTQTDAGGTGSAALSFTRTGTTVNAATIGAPLSVTGALSATGAFDAASIKGPPPASTTTTGTMVAADANTRIIATGNLTQAASGTYAANTGIAISAGASSRTVTRGSGMAMYVNGVNVASATIAARTEALMTYDTGSVSYLSGSGVS